MSGEPEPRRSVRATKGQHKALEQLDKPADAPKRRGKKGKKAATAEPEEEIIRCVCGATEQDEDQGEPWIACDQCGVWQHNICMGMSQYKEDLPREYFCEQCRPENHEELLDAISRGEHLWEARRKAYEEEEAADKKKKGPRKGKGKRNSDIKTPAKPSPAPESKKESKAASGKRKARDESQDKDKEATPSRKMRKVSETQAVPVPAYEAPGDLPAKLTELPAPRQGTARALLKSLTYSIGAADRKGAYTPVDGASIAARAERFAIEIERAVHDSHPNASAYSSQARTLAFNLKSNPDLVTRLLNQTLTPPMLAAMSTEELASKELQRETAEMKARAEKQAIKITEDGPRVRRTHKGEEVVGGDDFAVASDDTPGPSVARRSSKREPHPESAPVPAPAQQEEDENGREEAESPAARTHQPRNLAQSPAQALPSPAAMKSGGGGGGGLHVETQQPSVTDFDINKVFSSVKSPTARHNRHSSHTTGPVGGPGVDPEVDRMLQDDGNESPPYSPTEESDPDVIWRGELVMNTVASFQATARHVGGAKLVDTIGLPWNSLIPRRLKVAGRIDVKQAIEYLCGLRYSLPTDLVVVSLQPVLESSRPEFHRLIDYFVSKKRYGVVGDKTAANVRDTYLVPVPPGGESDQPEFMLNLADNHIPHNRAEPMLLAVFVYRNDADTVSRIHGANTSGTTAPASQSPLAGASTTPTPAPLGQPLQRHPSISAPAFSPASPQGTFPNHPPPPRQSHTPIQPPHVPHTKAHPALSQQQQHQGPGVHDMAAAQRQGEQVAHEILGPFITSPTVGFLMPQAARMLRVEWEVIRRIYERDQRAREDLEYLNSVLEKEPINDNGKGAGPGPGPAANSVVSGATAGAGVGRGGVPPPPAGAARSTGPSPQTGNHASTSASAIPVPAVTPTPVPPPHIPVQTPIPPPTVPPHRNTPIPPPPIPPGAGGGANNAATAGSGGGGPSNGGPPRQTPIPPPPIPPHATAAAPPA